MNRPENRTRRALISVSDKAGLIPFARGLADLSFELISTGGTAKALREAGLQVRDVSELTGFPEIMDGRVKTLHPAVHGGLLAREDSDERVTAEHGIEWIELLVVNLYPFQATVARSDTTVEQAIENIDVGGPAMLRAAAKNHARLTVVSSPDDYQRVLDELADGPAGMALRQELAVKAFSHTASYDAAISNYLHERYSENVFPDSLVLAWNRDSELRYGENPHQRAAFYRASDAEGIATGAQLQGKPLSFNNLADVDAALACVAAFRDTACVIVKHANPCGVAVAQSPVDAYQAAYRTDPVSAFGGIIAFNRPVDGVAARTIIEQQMVDVLVAPIVEDDAREVLATKKNLRALEVALPDASRNSSVWDVTSVEGGVLVQERDQGSLADVELRTVTQRAPSDEEMENLRFAWTVTKFVKSNAIVFTGGNSTLGIGAGQMSRVVSARIAAMKAADAGLDLRGASMASDAFFPFRDGIDIAAEHGITSVIQPGGSVRDDEVIQAADEHGIAMVLTGMRHFRH